MYANDISESKAQSLHRIDFRDCFQEMPNQFVTNKINEYAFRYCQLSPQELKDAHQKMDSALVDENLIKAGPHRKGDWNKGWGENLSQMQSVTTSEIPIPRYFGKIPLVRWKQQWIQPISVDFEYRMLRIIKDWLFDRYLRNIKTIYEFGCGTGHNLIHLRDFNPKSKLVGLDWAESSQQIIKEWAKKNNDPLIFSENFDFFKPRKELRLEDDSCIFTVAALEQVGKNFKPFLNFLKNQHIQMALHIEPIAELLDSQSPFDQKVITYFQKRNYLSGYLRELERLERAGEINILRAHRTHIGSFYIEGYSVIAWQPRKSF